MGGNWWDLAGLAGMFGRSDSFNGLSIDKVKKLNSTDTVLPDWLRERLDDLVDNIINNKFSDIR